MQCSILTVVLLYFFLMTIHSSNQYSISPLQKKPNHFPSQLHPDFENSLQKLLTKSITEVYETTPNCCNTTATPTATSTTTATTPGEHSLVKHLNCGCEDESLTRGVNYWLDIVFVVDSTDAVRDLDFSDVKSFVSLFGNLQIGTASNGDPRYSRIAVVNTGAEAEIIADLNRFKSGTDLQNTVAQKLVKKGGTKFNLYAGLTAAQDILTSEDNASRRINVPKVVIVFSTIPTNCGLLARNSSTTGDRKVDRLCSLATYLQQQATLITIGLKMAGATSYPHIDIANNCNRFQNSFDMTMNVLRALCRANCHCPKSYDQFATGDQCDSSGECVTVHQLSVPYASAVEICLQDGAVVADAATHRKELFLQSLYKEAYFSPFWIGLNFIDGRYIWSNNQSISEYNYNNWCTADHQPKISGGNCVYEDRCGEYSTGWFTAECGMMLPTFYFACQKDACESSGFKN
ncbi:unnamed protein product [Enterobius vermicularis]|uniref:C-type lectin n=1 Tax=Enterobius vermicularis TaxID=51028 RepID=A0A0N4USR9_ENTVE|nr:unnamed protein product [Enterobius vermicularis]